MDKFTELKTEFSDFLSFLQTQLQQNLTEEVSAYYTAAVLKIWGSNLLYSQDYAALLSAIWGIPYTMEQIMTAMSCCSDTERRLQIPRFFARIVELDTAGSNKAPASGHFGNSGKTSGFRTSGFTESFGKYDGNSGIWDKDTVSASVIKKLSGLLAASAMINGDFTIEEADCLSSIIRDLTLYAASFGINIPVNSDYQIRLRRF